jgi:hemolysin activation/secretion protein
MTPCVRSLFIHLAVTALVSATGVSFGQTYGRYSPPDIERLGPPAEELPQPDAADKEPVASVDDRVLVGSLDAVFIVDTADKVSGDEALDTLTGLHYRFDSVDSLVRSKRLDGLVEGYIGRPVTLRMLNQLAADIAKLYRRCGQPIVDVQIPEQRITGGTVHLVVIEPRIDRVLVQPGCWFDSDEVERWVECTRTGDRIYAHKIENDLLWLNQNPFYRVEVDFEPGAADGTTDVIYRTREVIPLRAFVGADDTGVRTLNYGRFYMGLIYGDLFNRGGILSYQYTADDEFNLLEAHSVCYRQPLDREWSLQSYGSWAGVKPQIDTSFNQDGESWQTGGGLVRHLFRSRTELTNLTLGLDFKSTNNNLEFSGTTISNSNADLVQIHCGLERCVRRCPDSYRRALLDCYIGPGGGMTGAHSAAAFGTIRPGATPDYFYSRVFVEDSRHWDEDWQLVSRFTGQLASERLLFSETLGLGGFDSIRGLDQRTYNADDGWIMNTEFGPRTRRWGSADDQTSLRPYVFMDMGNGYVLDPQPGDDASTFSLSGGVGARYQVSDRLVARFDYGAAHTDIVGADRTSRVHLGLTWIPGPRP